MFVERTDRVVHNILDWNQNELVGVYNTKKSLFYNALAGSRRIKLCAQL